MLTRNKYVNSQTIQAPLRHGGRLATYGLEVTHIVGRSRGHGVDLWETARPSSRRWNVKAPSLGLLLFVRNSGS